MTEHPVPATLGVDVDAVLRPVGPEDASEPRSDLVEP
jgi:hypothetical protein